MYANRNGTRVNTPVRNQIEIHFSDIDSLVQDDHRVREVWEFTTKVDLSPFYNKNKSRHNTPGRPQTDPAILFALWLYATIEGVGSARLLERLCERDIIYQWICGGVGVNHHTLGDFRIAAGPILDDLLSRSIAALIDQQILSLDTLAVDGVRVRADAGSGSFRSRPTLERLLEETRQHVARLRAELDSDPAASDRRRRARQITCAQHREQRIQAALDELQKVEAQQAVEDKRHPKRAAERAAKGKKSRVSITDPQARVMKMADGGFRPAYNCQVITAPHDHGAVIIGVAVVQNGSDRGLLAPTVAQVQQRYGQAPKRLLADGGYDGRADIEQMASAGIEVYVPPSGYHQGPIDPTPQPGDTPGVKEWRRRMASDEAKAIYGRRSFTEHPHADMRNRNLYQFPVRGLDKAKAVLLWFATVFNFLHRPHLPQPAS